ncbi:MAG: hypothetical protein C5B60_11305 [Chloroflexi bacterium]|nr:MAG: hypothetical protein C5B60_11305 [Chloroflexota bacterium]
MRNDIRGSRSPGGEGRTSRDEDDVRAYRRSNTRSKRDQPVYREERTDNWDDFDSDRSRQKRDRAPNWPHRVEAEDRARPRDEKFISPARPRPAPPSGNRPNGNRSGASRDRSREDASWDDEQEQLRSRPPRFDAPRNDRGMQEGRDAARSRQFVRPEDDEHAGRPPRRGRPGEDWEGRVGHQRQWSSWDDEPGGRLGKDESTWVPAWRREQAPTADWSDQDGPPGRGRRPRSQPDQRGPRGWRFATFGHRSVGAGMGSSGLLETGLQWALTQKRRILSTRRGRVVTAVVVASLLLGTLGSVGLAYADYHHVKSEASLGVTDLKSAETSLKTLESNPFDTAAISQAETQLGQAHAEFVQMNNSIQIIPGIFAVTPIVGSKLDAALKLGPIAVEATEAGILGCQILGTLAPKLQKPLSTNIPGLTSGDMSSVQTNFNALYAQASTLLGQIQQLPSSASSLDPRLGPLLATISTHIPQFTQGLQDFKNLMAVLPQLLGVGNPANYLLEVMDSTEIRPGGGFVGNFGAITFVNGRMQGKPQLKDVDLLDQHNCSLGLPIPGDVKWFTSGCPSTLLFQDSNLEPDFPTNAALSTQLYKYAGGQSLLSNSKGPITKFQGVIAITPWLIANALKLTGKIRVPLFNVDVDSSNLIQQIHHYQLTTNLGGSDTQIDPACGSSYRKAFTCELFKAFLSKLGALSGTNFSGLGKLLIDSIHSKDIQIYLTSPGAEALLLDTSLASALNAPKSGDGLMVVDADIDGIKANNYMKYTWNDQISLDSSGSATHHLVLTYQYPYSQEALNNSFPSASANKGCPAAVCYQDWIRIYIPASSTHISAPDNLGELGNAPTQASGFGMKVIQGLIFLPIGPKTFTVSLSWTVPNASVQTAGGGWLYQYAVEKQAGIIWPMNVSLTLPSCAQVYGSLQGFTTPTAHSAVVKEPLTTDVTLGLQYTC